MSGYLEEGYLKGGCVWTGDCNGKVSSSRPSALNTPLLYSSHWSDLTPRISTLCKATQSVAVAGHLRLSLISAWDKVKISPEKLQWGEFTGKSYFCLLSSILESEMSCSALCGTFYRWLNYELQDTQMSPDTRGSWSRDTSDCDHCDMEI